MPTFIYKAVTASGESQDGQMEARDTEAVVERLHGMGYIPIRVDSFIVKAPANRSFRLFDSSRVTTAEIGTFTSEIAILLEAGLPLDRALEILVSLSENQKISDLLSRIRDDVHGGSSLSEAMQAQEGVFSDFYVSMVRAGEAGGALGPVLARISDFMERSKALKETVTSALIYPSILVLVAVLSIMMLLMFVIPQFSAMFEQSGKALPGPTLVVIASGEFLTSYWWLLVLLAFTAYEFMRRQLANPQSKYKWDRRWLKLPGLGPLLTRIEVARFTRSLGILLANGVTLLNALIVTRDTVSNTVMAEGLHHAATQLKEGRGLAAPMMETELFPKLAVHMMMVGEETGELEAMLMKVADVYDAEVENTVKRLLSLLEPILILGMGLLVGGIIMSILMAILSINDLAI